MRRRPRRRPRLGDVGQHGVHAFDRGAQVAAAGKADGDRAAGRLAAIEADGEHLEDGVARAAADLPRLHLHHPTQLQRRAHPFARFGDRLVRQADDRERRQARGDRHLGFDLEHLDPVERHRPNLRGHVPARSLTTSGV